MSRLWLPQQGEEALHALHSATPALQPLFLQIAAHDQDSIGMNTSSAACLQGVVEGCTAAVQVSSSIAGGKQQSSADSSGCSLNGSRDQELLAWTATTASLRLVLQVMQQRQLLGTGVSLQQALVAFQDACYPCSQADQQG